MLPDLRLRGELRAALPVGVACLLCLCLGAAAAGAGERAERWVEVGRAVLDGFEADEATLEIYETVRERLARLDLASLYELLPEAEVGTTWRRARFRGELRDGRYRVEAGAAAEPFDVGDLGIALRARPVDGGGGAGGGRGGGDDRYRGEVRVAVGLGEIDLDRDAAAVRAVLRRALGPPPESALAAVTRAEPLLDPDDRTLLAHARAAMPETYELFREIVEIDDVIDAEARPRAGTGVGTGEEAEGGPPHPDPLPGGDGAGGFRFVRLVTRLDLEALDRRCPEVAGYVRDLRRFAGRIRARLEDAEGRTFGRVAIDGDAFRAEWTACLDLEGARLLAFDPKTWTPSEEGAIELAGDRPWKGRLVVDARVVLRGVTLDVAGAAVDVAYGRPTAERAVLDLAVTRPPRVVRVRGAALGLAPVWLIDLAIPKDLETIARDFFAAVAGGYGGRGARATIAIEGGEAGRAEASAEVEMEDNALVGLAFAIAAARLAGAEEAQAELRALARSFLEAIESDLGPGPR